MNIDLSQLVTADMKAAIAAVAEAAAIPKPACVVAAFNVAVVNGDIAGIEAGAGISAGVGIGGSMFMLFFAVAQPDTAYFPKVSAIGTRMRVEEKGLDYLIVSGVDAEGAPIDPDSFNVEIWRVA